MKHQIYFLVCPVSKKVSYVGVSVDAERRYLQHLADKSECSKARWIQALLEVGRKPVLVIVSEAEEQEAKAEEARWIAFGIGVGWPLRNDSLPNPDYIRSPYALPEYDVPVFVLGTVFKYLIPGEIELVPETNAVKRWWRWLRRIEQYPHILRVWFNTVDENKFCMYYTRSNSNNKVFEKPLFAIVFDRTCDMNQIKIRDTVWPVSLKFRQHGDNDEI